ncbi:IS3 family transposase [Microbulbifer sp. CnH-101-G]|uniref:IS3 family transposase n=1 Tax=Microbulbifer sp. CnH-101-G TaxID=3243393 RepID=UPI0040394F5C
MNVKDNCCDSVCAETFFHSLKVEVIYGNRYSTRCFMRAIVFEYKEIDNNRFRHQGANDYISPEALEDQFNGMSVVDG